MSLTLDVPAGRVAAQARLLVIEFLLLAAPGTIATGQGAVDFSVVRQYRALNGQTAVDAFYRVPLSALSPLQGTGMAVFRFTLTVRDSIGLALATESFVDSVPRWYLGMRGSSTGEHVSFRVAPGRYSLEATVTDSATGFVMGKQSQFQAFGVPVGASDLLLGTGLRAPAVGARDSVPRTGEIWTGVLFVETSGTPILTPGRSDLAYYVEVYTNRRTSVTVTARVIGDGGTTVVAVRPRVVTVGAGGGVADGLIALAGLPPGNYRLEVVVKGDSLVTRGSDFAMAGFETAKGVERAVGTWAVRPTSSARPPAELDAMPHPFNHATPCRRTPLRHGAFTRAVRGRFASPSRCPSVCGS